MFAIKFNEKELFFLFLLEAILYMELTMQTSLIERRNIPFGIFEGKHTSVQIFTK